MNSLILDTKDFDYGCDSCLPFMPTIEQINEATINIPIDADVSGFTMADWQHYDPYCMDMRNPYIHGYTIDGTFDPLLDYDPYAPLALNINGNQGAPLWLHGDTTDNMITSRQDMPLEITDIAELTYPNNPFTMPISESHTYTALTEYLHDKNSETDRIVTERDEAVRNYHNAVDKGNLDEALEWESIANDRQCSLYTHLDTPNYSGLPITAPGL